MLSPRPSSRIRYLCLAASLTFATPAAAQSALDSAAAYPPLDRFAGNASSSTVGQQPLASHDSLRNGVIVGTVIGVAAFGAFAAALCHAYQDKGGASCWPDTLGVAAIGGAIGAGAGLAIDAVHSHRGVTVRFAIRF